jgi:DNA polymerase-2
MESQQGFVLTRQWRDSRAGVELEYWLASDQGPVQIFPPIQQSVLFLPRDQKKASELLLKDFSGWSCADVAMHDFDLQPVFACYFLSQRNLRAARDCLLAAGLKPYESDINPHDRFLMERFIKGSVQFSGEKKTVSNFQTVSDALMKTSNFLPALKTISLDIETAMDNITLYSIGLYGREKGEDYRLVLMVSDHWIADDVEFFADEKSLLLRFFDWLSDYDPDIIIGWNIVNFDMWFLERVCQKHHIPFRLGRGRRGREAPPHWRLLDDDGDRRAMSVPGRVVLDGIELLKAAFYQFESFSLNTVATELLGDGKLIHGSGRGETITDLFTSDKLALAEYNIQDCRLVLDIFDKTKLIDFAIARTRITGLPLDRIGGSVASFDFRYLPLLHRKGYVAPNGHLSDEIEHSPGGFVMNSQPGIYKNVAVLDFKSLYPSIIRSFKIDPLGLAIGLNQELDQSDMVPGYNGAWFSKTDGILPDLIADLWQLRDQAKENQDAALSQAIKIIMNSFYGVLGTGGCRFFDSRLASSITRRGHQIIQQTAVFIEQQGWPVIYGDTDSVFVWFKDIDDPDQASSYGRQLESQLNHWWHETLSKDYGIDSALEIEFETLYQRFLMPTVRGSDQGSKKRYAGVVWKHGKPQLVFKGLESVRTDWTRLARDFQSELYRRIFFDEPYRDFIKETVQQVMAGDLDGKLIYRKRLRRKINDYQKNVPPHVQAARKAVAAGEKIRRGDWIEYVITINGSEPVSSQVSQVDYQHYIDKQLAPAADGILYFFQDSLAAITDQQMGLFG